MARERATLSGGRDAVGREGDAEGREGDAEGREGDAVRFDDDATSPGLSERDQEILVFERRWWRHAGQKEDAIREEFGLSITRYYQLLNALLDQPDALASDPVLVKRLLRIRDRRRDLRRTD